MFAPSSMPADRVRLIGLASRDVMREPQIRAKFEAASMGPVSAGPAQTAKMLGAYRAQWERVVKSPVSRNSHVMTGTASRAARPGAQEGRPARRPNVVYVVADDLGCADLGCYGGRAPVSPVIDSLATGGMTMTQGYANSPVCSPTRFAQMTDRYQYRLRGAAEGLINSRSRGNETVGLPPEHPTLPSLLRAAGYQTALIGKWDPGYPPAIGPLRSGYDWFFGPISGGVDFFTRWDSRGTHDLWLGHDECVDQGYITVLISHPAVDYVERAAKKARPFFLSLHYTAPHWP
jgi:arylsulfatase A-like enzyme